jgi:hypothetical protein
MPGLDAFGLPSVPPPAPATHPIRDALLVALLLLPLVAAGVGAYVSRDLANLPLEKRRAHAWPAATLQGPARELTSAFERAFGDRFGGRELLARVHHAIKAKGFGVSPVSNVMLGRDGWLFFLGEDNHALDRHFRGALPFEASVDDVVRELARRHEALAARGIAYVVVVVPDKFSIYPEYLPAWVTRMRTTPLDRVAAAMREDGRVRFLDLRSPLLAIKARRQVYYRTDSHWNYAGAAVGYEVLMSEVQRALPGRLPGIAPVAWPPYTAGIDTYSGDLASLMGVPVLFREDDAAPFWKVLADAPKRCAKRVDLVSSAAGPGRETYACAREGLPVAMIWSDSMAIPLIPLVSENFRRSIWISSRRIDLALVEAERPDIVIDQLVERALAHIPQNPIAP